MTKQKPATTNKLEIFYNNETSYTIPRVIDFYVAQDGKSVSGSYTKTMKFHGIIQRHNIDFEIDLVDVVGMSYEGMKGEVSKGYHVNNGRISSVTEWRTDDDYYLCKAKDSVRLRSDALLTINNTVIRPQYLGG